MCDSIWINEREWFPTILMCWIQLSNYFCFWLSARSSNTNKYFSYLNPDIVTAVKLLGKQFLMCGNISINKRECYKRECCAIVWMWWIQLLNHFYFWLSSRFSNNRFINVFNWNNDFVTVDITLMCDSI